MGKLRSREMKCAVPFHSGVESRFGKRILDAIAVFLTT
jgi:hypothetical protein